MSSAADKNALVMLKRIAGCKDMVAAGNLRGSEKARVWNQLVQAVDELDKKEYTFELTSKQKWLNLWAARFVGVAE